jgi:uncharacterized repeat protein (TIGR03803 family)
MRSKISCSTFLIFLTLTVAVRPAHGRTLYSFTGGADGRIPRGDLVLRDGKLYGTTAEGGSFAGNCSGSGCGTVFELTHNPGDSWTETVLYSFTGGLDGAIPLEGVTLDAAGNIYGTTSSYGDPSCICGTVFELTPSQGGWIETTLHDFKGSGFHDGSSPNSPLVIEGGSLYGTTLSGGTNGDGAGTLFQLTPSNGSWTETILHTFLPGAGTMPNGVISRAGVFFGTTQAGGSFNNGTVFRLKYSSGVWRLTTLYNFTGGDNGATPAGVTFDEAGHLYGTTHDGGFDTVGTVFMLTPANEGEWPITVLHDFTGGTDGAFPQANLSFDDSGNLFGTASSGGQYGNGTVFELTLLSGVWTFTTVHTFPAPIAGMTNIDGISKTTIGPSGYLYLTTAVGGADNYGVVFELHP